MALSPPAYLFVVRHGNRLDAADKSWHLSSPTPYDTPLTYGGFLQARLVGSQIAGLLERAKMDDEASRHGTLATKRPKRFKVVIHSSPFLRCVQTSVGISAGLAQRSSDSVFNPSDVFIPRAVPCGPRHRSKSALLRLDAFLGEWLSPEYFETITPPPGSALLLGGAKADLLRRDDYSSYVDVSPAPLDTPPSTGSGSLWQPSHAASPADDGPALMTSSTTSVLTQDESSVYMPPRPLYAVSSSGEIPEGIVAHARDACATVDYQWDSMRKPLDFGDGGRFGEEWTAMHKRFRSGLTKLLNWYATTDAPADDRPARPEEAESQARDEDVETVVIIVSHGAGCNALIGAITNQPVLMDVGIASITMASRKPDLGMSLLRAESDSSLVPVHDMYDLRQSASTDHLRSTTTSTPVSSRPASSRSASVSNVRNPSLGAGSNRGRTSTLGSMGGPVLSPFSYHEPPVGRNASAGIFDDAEPERPEVDEAPKQPVQPERREVVEAPQRPVLPKLVLPETVQLNPPVLVEPKPEPVQSMPSSAGGGPISLGLWSPVPSSLRLMDEGYDDADFDSMMPDFEQRRFSIPFSQPSSREEEPTPVKPTMRWLEGPVFAAPITLRTDPALSDRSSMLGLWGVPSLADDMDRFHDFGQAQRRWQVDERV
ncbi:hypothetical protein CDD80_7607 [Ophiocordyceps camponoti-rufipedis]|uniref:Uncharacterized protein n=1 Tax=Ophiocordyceps camponoti-rufipedis TaxID=2004952 RepID=A0A2C5YLE5_9HYPO|nr:hypothetical protein CDD80_7607 [Ophiocordyceps camponoti-rufipedis]